MSTTSRKRSTGVGGGTQHHYSHSGHATQIVLKKEITAYAVMKQTKGEVHKALLLCIPQMLSHLREDGFNDTSLFLKQDLPLELHAGELVRHMLQNFDVDMELTVARTREICSWKTHHVVSCLIRDIVEHSAKPLVPYYTALELVESSTLLRNASQEQRVEYLAEVLEDMSNWRFDVLGALCGFLSDCSTDTSALARELGPEFFLRDEVTLTHVPKGKKVSVVQYDEIKLKDEMASAEILRWMIEDCGQIFGAAAASFPPGVFSSGADRPGGRRQSTREKRLAPALHYSMNHSAEEKYEPNYDPDALPGAGFEDDLFEAKRRRAGGPALRRQNSHDSYGSGSSRGSRLSVLGGLFGTRRTNSRGAAGGGDDRGNEPEPQQRMPPPSTRAEELAVFATRKSIVPGRNTAMVAPPLVQNPGYSQLPPAIKATMSRLGSQNRINAAPDNYGVQEYGGSGGIQQRGAPTVGKHAKSTTGGNYNVAPNGRMMQEQQSGNYPTGGNLLYDPNDERNIRRATTFDESQNNTRKAIAHSLSDTSLMQPTMAGGGGNRNNNGRAPAIATKTSFSANSGFIQTQNSFSSNGAAIRPTNSFNSQPSTPSVMLSARRNVLEEISTTRLLEPDNVANDNSPIVGGKYAPAVQESKSLQQKSSFSGKNALEDDDDDDDDVLGSKRRPARGTVVETPRKESDIERRNANSGKPQQVVAVTRSAREEREEREEHEEKDEEEPVRSAYAAPVIETSPVQELVREPPREPPREPTPPSPDYVERKRTPSPPPQVRQFYEPTPPTPLVNLKPPPPTFHKNHEGTGAGDEMRELKGRSSFREKLNERRVIHGENLSDDDEEQFVSATKNRPLTGIEDRRALKDRLDARRAEKAAVAAEDEAAQNAPHVRNKPVPPKLSGGARQTLQERLAERKQKEDADIKKFEQKTPAPISIKLAAGNSPSPLKSPTSPESTGAEESVEGKLKNLRSLIHRRLSGSDMALNDSPSPKAQAQSPSNDDGASDDDDEEAEEEEKPPPPKRGGLNRRTSSTFLRPPPVAMTNQPPAHTLPAPSALAAAPSPGGLHPMGMRPPPGSLPIAGLHMQFPGAHVQAQAEPPKARVSPPRDAPPPTVTRTNKPGAVIIVGDWRTEFSPEHQAVFWVNMVNGRTMWEHPSKLTRKSFVLPNTLRPKNQIAAAAPGKSPGRGPPRGAPPRGSGPPAGPAPQSMVPQQPIVIGGNAAIARTISHGQTPIIGPPPPGVPPSMIGGPPPGAPPPQNIMNRGGNVMFVGNSGVMGGSGVMSGSGSSLHAGYRRNSVQLQDFNRSQNLNVETNELESYLIQAALAAGETVAECVFDFTPSDLTNPAELSIRTGEKFRIYEKGQDGWWGGVRLSDSKRGLFPAAYVQERNYSKFG